LLSVGRQQERGKLKASFVNLAAAVTVLVMAAPSLVQAAVPPLSHAAYSRRLYLASEARLSKTYAALIKRLPARGVRELIQSQAEWRRFRAADCEFMITASGHHAHDPKIYDELRYNCMDTLTSDRQEQLDDQIKCPGVEGIIDSCSVKGAR
jgi:uncharacterized protein YecT (DUF1311 family)